jgi:hypothetical protein
MQSVRKGVNTKRTIEGAFGEITCKVFVTSFTSITWLLDSASLKQ